MTWAFTGSSRLAGGSSRRLHDGWVGPPDAVADLLDLAADATPFDDVDYGEVLVTDVGPLTEAELAAPPHDWTSPWIQGVRMTTNPFEEWMAVDAMARTVLPAELGGTWDWNRWSWFDYRFAASEVDRRRVIDFQATCTEFVTDEEPACTIDARFDATTGELLEFSAS